MIKMNIPRKTVNGFLILCLMIVGILSPGSVFAQPAVHTNANGNALAAGDPLPIFRVITPAVNADITGNLVRPISGIFNPNAPIPPQPDTYRGFPRFSILNEQTHSILEQFAATGGFFAYNPSRAFGSEDLKPMALDSVQAQLMACRFLRDNSSLVTKTGDLSIPALTIKNCDFDFTTNPYRVSLETLSGQSSTPGASPSANMNLRIMVTVPILLNATLYSRTAPLIPLGGPGGHISMIFDETSPNATGPSLDDSVHGLQALAMPAFGRTFQFDRNVPSVLPADAMAQALARVQSSYPTGKNIHIPDPVRQYFMTDAGTPQTMLEPVWDFSGISVEVDGTVVVLKDLNLPAVISGPGGAGPTVVISSPANGFHYLPGMLVQLQGAISDGVAPYQYQWQMGDGSVFDSGTANAAGNLPLLTKNLPAPASKGIPGAETVHLVVTDSEGITREAVLSLSSPVSTYLPLLQRVPLPASDRAPFGLAPNSILQPSAINYSFGVEYGSDYPPYGPGGSDLGGVPPDANGLSSGLFGLGWPRVFNWYNANAWEKDWRDCSLGGGDCSYGVDRADYVYYSGHGNNGGISLPSNTHDRSWFAGTDARFQRARWISFSSCLTLRAQGFAAGTEPIRDWFNAFQGAHMILGFNSVMADIAFGPSLVDNMRMPSFLGIEFPWAQRTIAEAWVQTAFQMNAGKPAYLWATSATVNPVGNKLPKVTDAPLPRPYPVNWFFWVWWNE